MKKNPRSSLSVFTTPNNFCVRVSIVITPVEAAGKVLPLKFPTLVLLVLSGAHPHRADSRLMQKFECCECRYPSSQTPHEERGPGSSLPSLCLLSRICPLSIRKSVKGQ